jgi:phenylpropionate dioxygenase-like ring-hydroxylating dioxygenase large terminal subunit
MKKLLNKLANATVLDFEQAGSMPSEIYFSKEIHDLEIEKIFKTEWICIGRTAEIPARGDYLTFNPLDQSVIAIRQKDESIKVFANVCAHRCARLLEDCGNAARIVCPYHAWSYQTDGKLIAAPYMDKTAGFDLKDYQLKEVRWEIWQGYIYITLRTMYTHLPTMPYGQPTGSVLLKTTWMPIIFLRFTKTPLVNMVQQQM